MTHEGSILALIKLIYRMWRLEGINEDAVKIVKKAEELSYSNKAKIINITIPEKVKTFIEKNLAKEINH